MDKFQKEFEPKNDFGIPNELFTAIVQQSQKQINTSLSDNLSGEVTLTDAATISVDASLGSIFQVTLSGNRTMADPTNPTTGKRILFRIIQGVGSNTVTWSSGYRFSTGIPSPTLTTTVNYFDYVEFIYNNFLWDCIRVTKGFQLPP